MKKISFIIALLLLCFTSIYADDLSLIIKKQIENSTGDCCIELENKTYRLTSPINLHCDITGNRNITIRGKDKTVVSGAIELKNFKQDKNSSIFYSELPKELQGSNRLFQAFFNGVRGVSAGTRDKGYSKLRAVKQYPPLSYGQDSLEKCRQVFTLKRSDWKILKDLTQAELSQVRITFLHHWDVTKKFITKVNPIIPQIEIISQAMKPWNPLKRGKRFYFENIFSQLDSPGEWYTDGQIIYYYPQEGEIASELVAEIPVCETLFDISGTKDKQISNICFDNIEFKYTAFKLLPNIGFNPSQSASSIDAVINIDHANNINFTSCDFTGLGKYALWYRENCKDSQVVDCKLTDLGCGGLRIGTINPYSPGDLVTSNIIISKTEIKHGGRVLECGAGILMAHASDCTISQCTIEDFYYTGISVGWVWGYAPSPSKRNLIEKNVICQIGQGVLSDLAGIYTLGNSEQTIIRQNIITDIKSYLYGGWGLYTDEGSSHIVMEENIVGNTKNGCFHQHYGRENIIRNNIFFNSQLYQLQATRVEEHLSFTLENNYIIWSQGVLLEGPWEKINSKIQNNYCWKYGADNACLQKNYDPDKWLFKDPNLESLEISELEALL